MAGKHPGEVIGLDKHIHTYRQLQCPHTTACLLLEQGGNMRKSNVTYDTIKIQLFTEVHFSGEHANSINLLQTQNLFTILSI